jgi:hypothetical protein
MEDDWVLVETLGNAPVVVAQGRQMKDLVPIGAFLKKHPNLAAIQTAIAETVSTGNSLASITPKGRVIRTEPVQMSDGRIHGVHVWSGPADADPPERPIPGPLKWDLDLGVATDTVESLLNAGLDPDEEATSGRAFADDLPSRDLNDVEARVIALTIAAAPDRTYCASWDVVDNQGVLRRVGFVVRTAMELAEDGREHLIGRAMNLRGEIDEAASKAGSHQAPRILDSSAQPGSHRAIVDLKNWNLLKWLDDPCPYYDWRANTRCHPDDQGLLTAMDTEFQSGASSRILRLPGNNGGWVPIHVTVNRIEIEPEIFAGLLTLRLPTEAEVSEGNTVTMEDAQT